MKQVRLRWFIAVSMALNLAAATPAIGTILVRGSFRVDNATVTGNATLFEGATVETGAAGSLVELSSGARITLGATSKGRIFGDRMVLERGASGLEKTGGFRVEARGLTIQPETGNSTGRIALAGGTRVQVAVLSGTFRVLNSRGMVVAKVAPGMALAFEPQAPNGLSRLTGRVVKRGSHYLLTDETTNVTVEVSGAELARFAGKRVEVTGAMDPAATPVSDASQFIRVTSVKQLPASASASGLPTSDRAAAAAGGAAAKRAGAAGRRGMSGVTITILGGVATAAMVGGLAAAGGLSGEIAAPVSR